MKTQYGRLLLRSLTLAALLALSGAGSLLAQNWCDNPVPTPQPTPRPTPPPVCEPKECDKCTKSPCYVGSGTYTTNADDLTIKTTGFPLRSGRAYGSSTAIDGPMGFGWTYSLISRLFYAVYLFSAPSTYQKEADLIMPDGARYSFRDNGDGTFTPPQGRHDSLVMNADQTFDLTLQRTRSKLHFDSTGNLASMTDDYGNALQWTYDGNGRVQHVQDQAGSGRSFDVFWGADGRVSSVRDSSGRQVQYTYNASGALATVTDAASHVTTYSYFQGRFSPLLTRITDNWGRVITDVTYDTADRVHTYTDSGETYTYTYAYGGNSAVTSKADSQGNVFIYPFAANGLVSDTTPPTGGGGPTHTDYYADGSVQQFIDAVGVKTYYTYTANGNPLTVTRDYQGPNAVRLDYTYDPSFPAKVTSITPKNPSTNAIDPHWQAWQYDYYQATDPAPGALHHVYRVESNGTTLDMLATYAYDTHGRTISVTSATGGVSNYVYDTQGNLYTATGPANNDAGTRPVKTYAYDSLGRVTSATDPLGHATNYTYDPLDRVATVTLPKPSPSSTLVFTATYTYDNYDSSSGLVFVNMTDANGKLTKQGYDQYNQLVKVSDAAGNTSTYSYVRGLLSSTTDANGNATDYAYDAGRRLVTTTFPDGATERYTYTNDNLMYQRTDRKNQTITYAYDHFKRLASKSYPSSGAVTYTYLGQSLTQVVDTSVSPTETHTSAYDSAYRLQSETQAGRGTITRTYNTDDTAATVAVQSGPSTTYTRYPDGSLDTIQWSPVAGSFKYAYTLTGQYGSITFPNGQARNFSYDDQGRLTQLANLASGGVNIATYAYGYDLNYTTGQYTMLGRRASVTATVPSQGLSNHLFKYEYDGAYQLNRVTYPNVAPFNGEVDSWTYDAIGNRLTSTVNGSTQNYMYQKIGSNPLNWQRLTSDGTNAYTYDANGSAVSRTGYTFGWDSDNRLTSITGGVTASYVYDYQGRRSSKTVGAATGYLYDGFNLTREAGASSADYLYGPGIDEPLAMSRAGQIYYFETDALGSVNTITNAAATVQNTYLYDAWGQIKSQTGSLGNPLTYTAREVGEAGLNFYRARFYEPSIGRFPSEDPLARNFLIAFANGYMNTLASLPPYAYALNSPIQRRDPTGLDAGGAGQGDQAALTCVQQCVRGYIIAQLQCEFGYLFGEIACTFISASCARGNWYSCAAAVYCWITINRAYTACEAAAANAYIQCLKGCCPKV
jgi:RHS repeat-associated protein